MKKLATLLIVLFIAPFIYGQTQPTDTDGDGYYNISTLDHLRWVSENKSSWSWNFELDNDIDASDTRNWNVGDHDNDPNTPDSAMGWSPIGTNIKSYKGNFDGHNYTISNLYINRADRKNIGFFGYTASSKNDTLEIKNLGILRNRFRNSSSASTSFSGGLIGINYKCVISNCYVTGSVSSASASAASNSNASSGGLIGKTYEAIISNCYATGNISSSTSSHASSYSGGLIGENSWSSINNCYATGNSSATAANSNSYSGGLIGKNAGASTSNCYATGNSSATATSSFDSFARSGGLIGENAGASISNCYSMGNVSSSAIANNSAVSYSGGLIGNNFKGSASDCYSMGLVESTGNKTVYLGGFLGKDYIGTFSNNFWDKQTSGQATSAGEGPGEIEGKTTAEMKIQATFLNWDFTNIWAIHTNFNSGYPIFKNNYTGNIIDAPTDTDGDGYYNISTLAHLRWISENDSSWTWNFELDDDIDASDTKNWNVGDHDNDASTPDSAMGWSPIGNDSIQYTGKFDGHDHTISDLYINRMNFESVGFFGCTGYKNNDTAEVKNLGIWKNRFRNSSSSFSGGLIGANYYGSIINCYATGNSSSSSADDSFLYSGGLIGYNSGDIINCYATGNSASSSASSSSSSGGLIGKNGEGRISNCYATGLVEATGNQTIYIGGFLGRDDNSNGTFSNNFWDIETSGQATSTGEGAGKIEGKTTAEMKTKSTFTNAGWDFTIIWLIDATENDGYPYLRKTFIQSIELSPGWNFISSNIVPDDSDIVNIFDDIKDNFLLSRGDNSTIYFPDLTLNSIINWNFKKGYSVYMTKADTLNISGFPAPNTTTIDLKQGWNMISFLMSEETDITTALAGISNDLLLVKDGDGKVYFPNLTINTIGTMKPGKGYYIYMKNAATLDYP